MQRPHVIANKGCPICGLTTSVAADDGANFRIDCSSCGAFRITRTAAEVLAHWDLDETIWTKISYQLRRMTDRSEPPKLNTTDLEQLRDGPSIPTPDVILDEFVLWLGSHLEFAGQAIDLKYESHKAVLGAVNSDAYNYLLAAIAQSPWFAGKPAKVLSGALPFAQCTLTPSGWARYRELSASKVASRYGFMAMKYNDPELDGIVRDWFVPAVKAVGFELRRLDDGQAAGLIDDQLRVAIRTSRFLVCDLTHGNRGAYWEAGYAEGLGRPVIYTCRADVFNDKSHVDHPHFDTGHLVTIPWSPTDPGTAAAKLKATIRATLPAEATLVD